jgi:hypothetical protein
MEFTCKHISISKEFMGYQIKFQEKEEDSEDNHEYNENDNYLLIQKSFGEDENDHDYVHIESNNRKFCGNESIRSLALHKCKLIVEAKNKESMQINFNCSNEKNEEIKKMIKDICPKKWVLKIEN